MDSKMIFDYIKQLEEEVELKNKIIENMAEELTTPIHSKKWVINFYKNKCKYDL